MVLKKVPMKIGGEMVEVEVFETEIIPGQNEDEAISMLDREVEIEKEAQRAIRQIEKAAKQYSGRKRDITYYYRVGKLLGFVDEKGFTKERIKIWQRLSRDLDPHVFFSREQLPNEDYFARYPEAMYWLAKLPVEDVQKITWSHWLEIEDYQRIREKPQLVSQLINECMTKSYSHRRLRERLQEINKELVDKENQRKGQKQ